MFLSVLYRFFTGLKAKTVSVVTKFYSVTHKIDRGVLLTSVTKYSVLSVSNKQYSVVYSTKQFSVINTEKSGAATLKNTTSSVTYKNE